jgi:RNA recognition motif-containing protein
VRIYVGNLPYETTEQDLSEAFSPYGEVASVSIVADKFSGRSRGFAFVEMASKSEGEAAIEALNGKAFMNRNLVVNEARPREDRGGGGGFGRSGGGYGGGGGGYGGGGGGYGGGGGGGYGGGYGGGGYGDGGYGGGGGGGGRGGRGGKSGGRGGKGGGRY